MNHDPNQSELGKKTLYPKHYDPSLLFPIARQNNREGLHIHAAQLPFKGFDIWNAFEVSWLNLQGKPEVRLLRVVIPCESPNIIESKSFKLYLNSFNDHQATSEAEVLATLQQDIDSALGSHADYKFYDLASLEGLHLENWSTSNIDGLDIHCSEYHPNPQLLKTKNQRSAAQLSSNLLKSNCPVTNQPDWASVMIDYEGQHIIPESFLEYIVSFRHHNGFHEECVERIFCDIMATCQPEILTVYARFTRRGGLDINPIRSTEDINTPEMERLIRQ